MQSTEKHISPNRTKRHTRQVPQQMAAQYTSCCPLVVDIHLFHWLCYFSCKWLFFDSLFFFPKCHTNTICSHQWYNEI